MHRAERDDRLALNRLAQFGYASAHHRWRALRITAQAGSGASPAPKGTWRYGKRDTRDSQCHQSANNKPTSGRKGGDARIETRRQEKSAAFGIVRVVWLAGPEGCLFLVPQATSTQETSHVRYLLVSITEAGSRPQRPQPPPQTTRENSAHAGDSFLPRLEVLEDRTLLSTFKVLNLGDAGPGSLRQAIFDANSHVGADLIRFAPKLTGTITLSSQLGELKVTDDLRIDGPGADRLTVSGGEVTRVFAISGGETDVLIDDLTIADGMATGTTVEGPSGPVTLGGGILNTGARLTLSHVTLVSNQAAALPNASAAGGGIANVFEAALTVDHCTFTDNRSIGPSAGVGDSRGGAIFNDVDSTLTVTGSTFTGNQATGGSTGATHAQGVSLGGAIENAGGSEARVSDSTFKDNLARGADGDDSNLAANGRGGGIDNWRFSLLGADGESTLTVTRSTFTGNQALGGAGGQGCGRRRRPRFGRRHCQCRRRKFGPRHVQRVQGQPCLGRGRRSGRRRCRRRWWPSFRRGSEYRQRRPDRQGLLDRGQHGPRRRRRTGRFRVRRGRRRVEFRGRHL